MFVSCPHCGFLVALVAARKGTTQRCPRCNGEVQAESTTAAATSKPTPRATPRHGTTTPAAAATAPAPVAEAEAEAENVAPTAPPASVPDRSGESDTNDANAEDASAESSASPPAAPETEPAADVVIANGDDDAPVSESEALIDDAVAPSFEEAIAASAIAPAKPRSPSARTARHKRATPSFARTRTVEAPRRPHWRGYAAIAALSLLLVLQLLLAQRAELAAQERWRPLVAAICGVLFCELPPWHEPGAFTMLNRSVQPKTGMAGVLTVSASFRNDARWPQPWPTVVLSLSDVDGQVVGQRAFRAEEYRNGGGKLLSPGQTAEVQLDVIEPAPRIVAFTFDFR